MLELLISIPAMIMLGVRHGVDADHIIAIDNLVRMHNASKGSALIGSGFSMGHTISVLIEIIFIIFAIGTITSERLDSIVYLGSIIGVMTLATLGVMNMFAIKRLGQTLPSILARRIVYKTTNLHPFLSSMIVGMIFGLGFDTATQILAITLSAVTSVTIGIQFALILAAFFTIGMISIDTLDSVVLRTAFSKLINRQRYFKNISYSLSASAIIVASAIMYENIFNVEIIPEMFGPILTAGILGTSLTLAFISK